jgi:DNA-binding NtrC family response regulator
VLAVADDASVLTFLYLSLRDHGLTVWAARDGEHAIEVYRKHHASIRAVLLDVRLSGESGPATLAALRQVNPAVRYCLVTDGAGRHDAAQLLRRGAAEVLHKPFEFSTLLRALLRLAAG